MCKFNLVKHQKVIIVRFRKTILILVTLLIIPVIAFLIFKNLPLEVTRKSDIEFGNKLISNIDKYKTQNNKLPESDDWKTLQNLDFKIEMLGTKPAYEKINDV